MRFLRNFPGRWKKSGYQILVLSYLDTYVRSRPCPKIEDRKTRTKMREIVNGAAEFLETTRPSLLPGNTYVGAI